MELNKHMRDNLIHSALEARKNAYTPYSHYLVGAALLTEGGEIITGCNIENASFGATICAERTAFFKAISNGIRTFSAIAIVGGREGEEAPLKDFAFPCGICRQVINEFTDKEFLVIVAKSVTDYKIFTQEELLPFGFGGDKL